jgi:hypothetical protein
MRLSVVIIAIVSACTIDSTEPPAGTRVASVDLADEAPRFSGWSAPINLGSVANSINADMNPDLSKKGLSLYFAADRSGAFGIWVSQRADVDQPWGPAQFTPIDRANQPTLSPDEHELFFNSGRPGSVGLQDLWVSRRADKRDDLGWQQPMNLPELNTAATERGPALFEDEANGTVILYFDSDRVGGMGGTDIYASTRRPDHSFGPPVLVAELNSPADDAAPAIRKDGLEIVFTSTRLGFGGTDLWVATRRTTTDPWSTPVNLGPGINSAFQDGGATLSRDGTELYFHSNANRPGAQGPCFGDLGPCFFDNYVATRTKLRGGDR